MRTSLIYFFLLLSSFLVFSANETLAQVKDVKINFKVEGKLQKVSRFAIIFHTRTGSFLAISKNRKF
jgi:hypothetical protein